VEHHIYKVIQNWNGGPRKTKAQREALDDAKIEWDSFVRNEIKIKYYELEFKKVKLTGEQADLFLKIGHRGIPILDPDPMTLRLWNLMTKIVSILQLQEINEKNLKELNLMGKISVASLDYHGFH
jgi:hypothetical protein